MAQVIERFERVAVPGMEARLVSLGPGERWQLAAGDETLVYVVGEERVVWLDAGERFEFEGPATLVVGAAR